MVLGDLIDFVDYHDHGGGILGAVFGAERVSEFAELRRNHRGPELGAYVRSLWASLDDPRSVVKEAVLEQYSELFAAMTAPTYAIAGNVDEPGLWSEFARSGLHFVDGETVEIEWTARELCEVTQQERPDPRRVRLLARGLRATLTTGTVANTLGVVLLDGLDEAMQEAGVT